MADADLSASQLRQRWVFGVWLPSLDILCRGSGAGCYPLHPLAFTFRPAPPRDDVPCRAVGWAIAQSSYVKETAVADMRDGRAEEHLAPERQRGVDGGPVPGAQGAVPVPRGRKLLPVQVCL